MKQNIIRTLVRVKKGKRIVVRLIFAAVFLVSALVGCEFSETSEEKIKDLEYTESGTVTGTVTGEELDWGVVFLDGEKVGVYKDENGTIYPVELQDRICGGRGHLSNAECAEAVRNFMHPGLNNIFLCKNICSWRMNYNIR